MGFDTPIAVVGMSGLFPGALDVHTLWANILAKRDTTAEVRRERWIAAPESMVSAELQPDKAYSTRCCLLPEFEFDPRGLDLDPELAAALDPLYHVVLQAGRDAVTGAGAPVLDRDRTGVILAAIVLPTESSSALTRDIIGRVVEAAVLGGNPDWNPDPTRLRERYFASRVAALPAALLAQAFGLGGGSYTLDAACASSLYAVKLACDELCAGRADAMLTGGVSRPDSLFTQVGFSQLRALSPSGCCAPFDRRADGLVVGEGAGLLVLKRLGDALRHKDRIFGLIRGVGLSNDLRGNLLAPDSEGQLRAMHASYAASGWSPADVDYIECHGAGTPVGDVTELASLRRLWGESGWNPGQCAIGSVKSMIGHLLTAAGAAGMIKTLLGMHHGILPPTIHFSEAPAGSPLEHGPFRVQTEPEPWNRRRDSAPRRAAVSAFGFGGINAHLLLEEWVPTPGRRKAEGEMKKALRLPFPGVQMREPQSDQPPASRPADCGVPLPHAATAVVGMAVSIGRASSLNDFAEALQQGRSLVGSRPKGRWKGCDQALSGLRDLKGVFLEEINVETGAFRIPPREIPDILPQHLLMLKTAADAVLHAGLPLREERPTMGAVIGIDFDFAATDFHLRWYLEQVFPEWIRSRFPHLPADSASRWLSDLKEACSPPLTANRVLGALGSMVASRIARELHLGGASFVVSAEAASGLRALDIGVRALQSGELDTVLVGAVDLRGDLRSAALQRGVELPCPADGAVALVLKRLDQARSDGHRICAIVRGFGAATGGGMEMRGPSRTAYIRSLSQALSDASTPADAIGLFEGHGSDVPGGDRLEADAVADVFAQRNPALKPISSRTIIGDCGAATGLASLVKAALGIPCSSPAFPYAVVAAMTVDGNCLHAVLERHEGASPVARHPVSPTVSHAPEKSVIRVAVAGRPLRFPPPPLPAMPPQPPDPQRGPTHVPAFDALSAGIIENLGAVSEATARAHAAYLDLSLEMTRTYAEAVQLQTRMSDLAAFKAGHTAQAYGRPPLPAFDRGHCLEFARGSAARVLGPEFAEVDTFAARVRLPDEPLMLVDRILEIQGAKASLGPGRIVTEHDVLPGAWYLDGGRAPVCIAVEAGQADLFLCAYLGIDLAVRGRRTYRLLDATVRFHRELPRPGETIRYAIRIEKFLRQGDTYLFLFNFRGAIEGAPLITMTDGCAGFFTPEEVANSGGIILTDEEKQPRPGKKPADWINLLPMATEAYDERALDALRAGNPAACFGERFTGIVLPEFLRLPDGRMRLIDRVIRLEPEGGRYGMGRIRAEADIHPDDWFLTCHFVDDMVMPGTLMYECCAHTLRVMVQRMGWILDRPGVRYEPVRGVDATLKCRGPVTPETRHVIYEVDLKEVGYGPQPFVIADANMYADGQPIVRFTNMSLQLTGATRTDIEAFWKSRPAATSSSAPASGILGMFTRGHLEEFATGRPSAAFGDRYAPFDAGRFIARLPAPPYLCVDRIMRVEPPPWVVKPGGWVEAEFDVPPEAWHIASERTGDVPYCILLEAALQPCGWLAAYMGSALKSENPLHFRNLGGHGILHRTVDADAGTLRVKTRMTHASEVTDMVIEHFDFEIHGPEGLIYDGSTYFGFFTKAALGRQEGIRDPRAKAFAPPADGSGGRRPFVFPAEAPLHPHDPNRTPVAGLAYPAKALSMLDRIELYLPEGGPKGLGFVRGAKEVDPAEWFFTAHFYQDPVCPGSLGIESFLQLLKFAARERWPHLAGSHRFATETGRSHRWTYRGQILPSNKRVTVEAAITQVLDSPHPTLVAEGYLMVDGIYIYRMEEFGIQLIPGQMGVKGPAKKDSDAFRPAS
jgi:acyl transferase domain-containing protein/3-hydroxymyristoyl/3-hydroxydecanoyl-(acyl carrier protein) dehydratase